MIEFHIPYTFAITPKLTKLLDIALGLHFGTRIGKATLVPAYVSNLPSTRCIVEAGHLENADVVRGFVIGFVIAKCGDEAALPTLALGTEMHSIPLCPCCHQSEGSCSCPAGRCPECSGTGDDPNGTNLTACDTCGGNLV